jgi:hypothetical protein
MIFGLAYRQYFDRENADDPGVSGAKDGRSCAFVKEIRFYREHIEVDD